MKEQSNVINIRWVNKKGQRKQQASGSGFDNRQPCSCSFKYAKPTGFECFVLFWIVNVNKYLNISTFWNVKWYKLWSHFKFYILWPLSHCHCVWVCVCFSQGLRGRSVISAHKKQKQKNRKAPIKCFLVWKKSDKRSRNLMLLFPLLTCSKTRLLTWSVELTHSSLSLVPAENGHKGNKTKTKLKLPSRRRTTFLANRTTLIFLPSFLYTCKYKYILKKKKKRVTFLFLLRPCGRVLDTWRGWTFETTISHQVADAATQGGGRGCTLSGVQLGKAHCAMTQCQTHNSSD